MFLEEEEDQWAEHSEESRARNIHKNWKVDEGDDEIHKLKDGISSN